MRVIDLIEDIAYISNRLKERNGYSDEDIARYTVSSLSRRDLSDYLQSSIGPEICSNADRLLAMVVRMAEIVCLSTPAVGFAVSLPEPMAACVASPTYAKRFDLEAFPSGLADRQTIAMSALREAQSPLLDNMIGLVRTDQSLREIVEFLCLADAGKAMSALILAPGDLIERYAGFWAGDPTTRTGSLLHAAERPFGFIHAFRRNHRD